MACQWSMLNFLLVCERKYVKGTTTIYFHVRGNMWRGQQQSIFMWEGICEGDNNNLFSCEREYVKGTTTIYFQTNVIFHGNFFYYTYIVCGISKDLSSSVEQYDAIYLWNLWYGLLFNAIAIVDDYM